MEEEDKFLGLFITGIVVMFFVVITTLILTSNIKEIEFAKAGLQQCREDGNTVWKKECK